VNEPRWEMFAASVPSIVRNDTFVRSLKMQEFMGKRIIPTKSTDLVRDPDTDVIASIRGIRRKDRNRY